MLIAVKAFSFFVCAFGFARTQEQASEHFRKTLNGSLLEDTFLLPEGRIRCSGALGCTLTRCAQLCAKHGPCRSFSFRKTSRQCNHYDVLASSAAALSTAVSEEGWATWEKSNVEDWLESACSTNQDCPVTNSVCYRTKCICSPEFFYSYSAKTCNSNCTEDNLRTTYSLYPHGGFVEYGTPSGSVSSRAECTATCTADSQCVSAGAYFNEVTPTCYLYYVKPGPGCPFTWEDDWDYWDTYQKHCA